MTADLILLVEDDDALAELLDEELTAAGYATVVAGRAQDACAQLAAAKPALVISDLRLPDGDGMAVLAAAREQPQPPAFLIVTAFGSIDQAVAALKAGADDFLTKPLDFDHLLLSVERLLERQRMRREVRRFRAMLDAEDYHGLVGRSRAMLRLFDRIAHVASADGPVLILGESGTGKELVARAIHAESARAEGPFVAVNCAGIPTDLMESEFFGHVAGAFTGARQARAGLFAEAAGGTLLLDEIGEMPLALQAKLLRVLEDGSARAVGSDSERHLDVRVLAATHQDLPERVRTQAFRADLYFRLETFTLQVPPLRERGTDIDHLAEVFLQRQAERAGRPLEGIDEPRGRPCRTTPGRATCANSPTPSSMRSPSARAAHRAR